ncbi:hypothetical protein ABZ816_02575 [Actinosynnema sp. NPDC047251]|uniref:Orc1-like AAA ATPase domain-containing protein n=1 Tax=Saccharothrix espanaensis (strain ATCC 51144 / DSM 44229 / JCM 9112 / NBRC 15066 / NRRL 15764) TaxID=1179773 RepID=K0K0T5_SACES|nr:ATP-binding protein [Saccharothrix espanaensis]CCH31137.1 hypothetical protein BN6_38470 [Saccharothrix espanaensis DSM 44229]
MTGLRNEVSSESVATAVQVGVPHGGMHLSAPPEQPVPRQLPAPPAHFTGREADLARLDRALDGAVGTVVISAVTGAGGIGKTWLALHWAHRNAHRFPDGVLPVDLRGFSPDDEPVPASVAVRGFLGALGVWPAAVPVDEHAQAALSRTLVTSRRRLPMPAGAFGAR